MYLYAFFRNKTVLGKRVSKDTLENDLCTTLAEGRKLVQIYPCCAQSCAKTGQLEFARSTHKHDQGLQQV